MKVLVVDDAEISLVFITRLLTKFEHEVVTCRSGEAAIELMEKGELPQVTFLDWMLPGASGIDVCKKIRAVAGGNRVFIVFMTARGCDKDRLEAIGAGADIYLPKPIKVDQLRSALVKAEQSLFAAKSPEVTKKTNVIR